MEREREREGGGERERQRYPLFTHAQNIPYTILSNYVMRHYHTIMTMAIVGGALIMRPPVSRMCR